MLRLLARRAALLAVGVGLVSCGSDSRDPVTPATDASVSSSVMSGQDAVVRNDDGVALSIFSGTVPTDPTGSPGQLVFSIEPADVPAAAPSGFTRTGQVWQMGPEGLTFAERCRLIMPAGDPDKQAVLGRFDSESGQWHLMPTVVEISDNQRICADVKHLSIWSSFVAGSGAPGRGWGAVRIRNTDGSRLVSICIKSFTLRYPDTDVAFDPLAAGCTVAEAGHNGGPFGLRSEINFVLPQGTYVFEATRSTAGAPFAAGWADGWIEMAPVTIEAPWAPGTAAPEVPLHPSGWQNVNTLPAFAPCEGTPDYSFGTGAVQVTLTWDPAVDLDLHVVEPSGEEIFYNNTSSASGGRLDRDRLCGSTTRSPENIFWAGSVAPRGSYAVKVHLFNSCSSGSQPIPFRLRTVVDGVATTINGSVQNGETRTVTTFSR